MAPAVKTELCYVQKDLAICGGDPIIVGTRIPVRLIYQRTKAGETVDTIRQTYPHLTPAHIHDPLSYAYDRLADIEQEIRREDGTYLRERTHPSR